MRRCSWCNRILWPFQAQSLGRSMHFRCSTYVDRITGETQRQYQARPMTFRELEEQAALRWEEEDRL